MHKSTKWLIGEMTVVVLIVLVLGFCRHPLLLAYPWHKLLHTFGAVLLVGNIMVTAVWMLMAERSHNVSVMQFTVKAVNWADVVFTIPGVFLLISNGDILSEQWGGVLRTSWITASLALLALSGILWIGFLLRYQNRLIKLSQSLQSIRPDSEFARVLHRWYFFGAAATVLPLISLILMVFKPGLW